MEAEPESEIEVEAEVGVTGLISNPYLKIMTVVHH